MRDFRHALRSLRRSPGFVAVAILALGLGLGLTTSMFGVIEAIRHPYVPFENPERLYSVAWFYNLRRPPLTPFEMYRAIRDETQSFDAVLPVAISRRTLETGPNPGDITLALVPPRLFQVLGLTRGAGRQLTEADEHSNAVVISYGLWRRAFGGRPTAIGSTILLGGNDRTVVGIMPRGMSFPMLADAWMAMPSDVETAGARGYFIRSFVRLKPGVSAEQARTDVQRLAQRLTAVHQEQDAPFSVRLLPVAEQAGRVGDLPKFMLAAAFAILFIACANLANLMLARGTAKRRELALRMAIGASAGSIVRQQFTESLLMTIGGMGAGFIATLWCADVITNQMPPQMDWIGLVQPRLSVSVFLLSAGAAGLAAILFGLLPAVRIVRDVDVAEPLKEGGTATARSHRRHSWMVIGQLALTLPLLVVAVTTFKILSQLKHAGSTYAANELLSGTAQTHDSALSPAGLTAFGQQIRTIVASVPGVRDVAVWTTVKPPNNAISAEMTSDSPRVFNVPTYDVVSTNFLRAYGLPIIAGRDFEPGDIDGLGVAVLDAVGAARLYPHGSAVGHMVRLGGPTSNAPWAKVVGVARVPEMDNRREGDEPPQAHIWVVGSPNRGRLVNIMIRTPQPDGHLAALVTRRIREATGGVVSVRSWLEDFESQLAALRFYVGMFVTLGLCALGLAAIGLYGVVGYTVSLRMREFAIRIALGADRPDVQRLVLHDAFVMILAGTGLGAVPALGIAGGAGLLSTDALILSSAESLLIGAMLLACLLPVRRAVRADPLDIIRAV